MRPVFWILLCLSLTSGPFAANARIVGKDDRIALTADYCQTDGVTVGRLLVEPTDEHPHLSTVTAVQFDDQETFYLGTAHSLFKDGKLRAPLDHISVELLVPDPLGGCRFRTSSISRFAVGSTKPRQTFWGAARDLLVFQIDNQDIDADAIKPIRLYRKRSCRTHDVRLTGFAWGIKGGLEPFRTSCKLRRKSAESDYPEAAFQHHDCDTSTGTSGSLLLCEQGRHAPIPYAVHAVGWGESGREFGRGVYNVAIPVDAGALRMLFRAMRVYGD